MLPRLFEFASKLPRTHLPTLAVGVVTLVGAEGSPPLRSSSAGAPHRRRRRRGAGQVVPPRRSRRCRPWNRASGAAVVRVDTSTGSAFRALARRRLWPGAGEFHERDGDRAELCPQNTMMSTSTASSSHSGRAMWPRVSRTALPVTGADSRTAVERCDGRQDKSDRLSQRQRLQFSCSFLPVPSAICLAALGAVLISAGVGLRLARSQAPLSHQGRGVPGVRRRDRLRGGVRRTGGNCTRRRAGHAGARRALLPAGGRRARQDGGTHRFPRSGAARRREDRAGLVIYRLPRR